ncbi:hypothetical protein ASF58_23225 [Methylobacterium sp. Leaf125]|uniref:terminase small subunit n=1 Tax=Methylobacterium sp. Leaf125 TaxID=1736265 RepID=UPI0006FA560C|nr:terminase small subunit [Methylobacterium sp. Leaf125]KQQ39055.1 hypothetical protein ASF58_23225 [Methylobacterium sp. Leaf125]
MLNDRQALFVEEYLVDMNGAAAARRAGYSEATARSIAHELLTKPDIVDAIAVANAKRLARVHLSADQVLEELATIARADVNDLVEYRIGACRYCHGIDHRYQRTRGEFERFEREYSKLCEEKIRKREEVEPFDPEGGIGFDPRRVPHPECSECFGDGEGRPVFKDTAKASSAARRLYDGVKVTKDGFEMKLRSRDHALDQAFKHLGLGAPQKVEHTGKDGAPIEHAALSPKDLARRMAFTLARGAQLARAAAAKPPEPPTTDDQD